jgi:maltose O-acetyltransferase
LIKLYGGKIEKEVFIGEDVLVDYDFSFLLEIGKGSFFSAGTLIELHDSSLPNILGKGKAKIRKITLECRAYIGVNHVILPGVTIGENSIVGTC